MYKRYKQSGRQKAQNAVNHGYGNKIILNIRLFTTVNIISQDTVVMAINMLLSRRPCPKP